MRLRIDELERLLKLLRESEGYKDAERIDTNLVAKLECELNRVFRLLKPMLILVVLVASFTMHEIELSTAGQIQAPTEPFYKGAH